MNLKLGHNQMGSMEILWRLQVCYINRSVWMFNETCYFEMQDNADGECGRTC